MTLSSSLGQVESALHRLNRQVLLRSLRAGMPSRELRTALRSVGLAATADLEILYSWHDGTATENVGAIGDICLFPGFYQLSIEDSLSNYREFVSDDRWQVGWLPVFADGGGDFYVQDLAYPAMPPVRRFRLEESEHPVEYTSLSAMLTTLAAAFERRAFYLDSRGYLEEDAEFFARIAAELNPEVEWWR